MRVDTAEASWTVPTHRAVLIPSNAEHQVLMEGVSTRTRSLYIVPAAAPWFPNRCQVVDVSPCSGRCCSRRWTCRPSTTYTAATGRADRAHPARDPIRDAAAA